MIDATDVVLGRLASQAATLLRGKHKPTYAPHMDTGDFVIIVNAEKISVAQSKRDNEFVYRHSGYPGGLRKRSVGEMIEKHPDRLVEKAVKGVLPKNRLGRAMGKKLKVYAGPAHPHTGAEARRLPDHPGRSVSETTGTDYPEEGQPVTTPEPEIEAVEEAAVEAEALDLADAADEYEAEVGNAAEIPVVYTERPVQTVGRRKEAVVRVRLMPGTGKFSTALPATVSPIFGCRSAVATTSMLMLPATKTRPMTNPKND